MAGANNNAAHRLRTGRGVGKGAVVAYFGPPIVLIAIVLMARALADVSISLFTRDPAAVLGGPFYVGLISNCGVLLWCAAATCCFLGFTVVRRTAGDDVRTRERAESARFLLASGAITTLLLLDDLFQLHEEVYRVYLHVPERVVVLVYGTIVAAYFWRFRAMIRRSEYGWLVVALGFFGVSVISDQLAHLLKHMRYLIEDGTKFLGIAAWFAYQSRASFALMRPANAVVTATTEVNSVTPTLEPAGDPAEKTLPSSPEPAPAPAAPFDLPQPSSLDRALVAAFTTPSDRAAASSPPLGLLPMSSPGRFEEHDAAIPELSIPSTPPIMR